MNDAVLSKACWNLVKTYFISNLMITKHFLYFTLQQQPAQISNLVYLLPAIQLHDNTRKNLYMATGELKEVWEYSQKTYLEAFHYAVDLLPPGQEISRLRQWVLS